MKRYWIVFLLILVTLFALLTGCGKKQKNVEEETQVQPQVQVDPDTVVCNNGKITLRFHKEDDKWVWVDDTDFPLDQAYVQNLLDTVQSLRELTPVTPAKELAEYGLEGAKAYVMLSNKDGEKSCIYLGKKADDGYYMYDGTEENGVYIAPVTLMEQISRSIYDMALLPTLPQLTMENMTALDLTAGEKEWHLTVEDGTWYDSGANVTGKMTAVTEALSRMEVSSCVDFRPASGAAGICGLTKDATVLTVSYDDKTFTLYLGAKRNDNGYYATVNDDTTIYLLATELAEPIMDLVKNGL